ncbi:hypothetical protein LEP1GSC133_2402 [Leptospira borgpetersenii serovar Pomona str. 200901868]|uniref:Uncharacterized protein n=2 Tax=Leptospira borgpetersenii TaxID=174 RepID=M6W3B2_LEPBO|nr:hypothetical protein LEP1GSC056_3664 [Leptospira borgpetersenii str. Brem 328]EMO61936.1 hypothetical protein LEP1GSC133_2402 [Leptospira borgpetersenii serovar Pomona str. 200901868]
MGFSKRTSRFLYFEYYKKLIFYSFSFILLVSSIVIFLVVLVPGICCIVSEYALSI